MTPSHTDPLPWWHYRIMWLVVGGPVVVVVAAIATIVIAVRGADVELHVVTDKSQARDTSPAVEVRSHSATEPHKP